MIVRQLWLNAGDSRAPDAAISAHLREGGPQRLRRHLQHVRLLGTVVEVPHYSAHPPLGAAGMHLLSLSEEVRGERGRATGGGWRVIRRRAGANHHATDKS